MKITLTLHFEASDDGLCWWAESDDIPGFVVAADTLEELRASYREAIEEIANLDDLDVTDTVEVGALPTGPVFQIYWVNEEVEKAAMAARGALATESIAAAGRQLAGGRSEKFDIRLRPIGDWDQATENAHSPSVSENPAFRRQLVS